MRRRVARIAIAAGVLAVIAGLVALGIWQIERRAWKHALIAQVEARLAAPPAPAPGPARWRAIDADDAYTRVAVTGRYVGADTLTQAVTEQGGGFWVLTPLRTAAGWTVLVNRGFVPAGAAHAPAPVGTVTVRGLLRTSEPGGGFLRANDPAAARWYSRDTAAIGRSRGLAPVAPYFIDAAAGAPGWPKGGMTVIRFRDSHLVYALTWFGLAALIGGMSLRQAVRSRRESSAPKP